MRASRATWGTISGTTVDVLVLALLLLWALPLALIRAFGRVLAGAELRLWT